MSAMHPSTGPLSPAEMIAESDFQTYGDWIDEQRHFAMWEKPDAEERAMLVVPMTYCPNVAGILDTSNWEGLRAALAEADPTGNDYSTCRFGHWATPFEFMTVRPGSEAHREAERIIAALADYPVLDEEDFSRRETEAFEADLERELGRLTIDGAEDGSEAHDALFCAIASVLCENESKDNCQRDEVEEALGELGYVYCEDDMTWRPIG